MNAHTRIESIDGAVGPIEIAIDLPDDPHPLRGVAVIAHPHPLFGGTFDNKVVQTLARACTGEGYVAIRPNFRGVGHTAGTHDEGRGETDDTLAVVHHVAERFGARDLVLAGFSFGSYVQTHVARRLASRADAFERVRLVLVGTATSRWEVEPVPEGTLVIHGELDDTVPLASVLEWARPQDLPVVVIPGADHFFHRKLTIIKRLVGEALARRAAP